MLTIAVAMLLVVSIYLYSSLTEDPGKEAPTSPTSIVGEPSSVGKTAPARATQPEEHGPLAFLAAFSAPISFYGRVVDERGDAIEGATVKFGVADKPWEQSKYNRTSNHDGRFELTGVRGGGLYVEVSKDGYYQTDESRRLFHYSEGESPGMAEPPEKGGLAVFKLRKKGHSVPLIVKECSTAVSESGAPVEIDLMTGETTPHGNGDVRVEVFFSPATEQDQRGYPWHSRITVREGGLMERKDVLDFTAPVDGYVPSMELKPSPELWRSGLDRSYFVRLRSGSFARIAISVRAGEDRAVFQLRSFVNPNPGERNLENGPPDE